MTRTLAKRRSASRRNRTSGSEARPTRQTLAKLQGDPLWLMLRRRYLTQEQVDAAHDIRDGFDLIARPGRLRAMRTVTTVAGTAYDLTRISSSPGGAEQESVRSLLLQERLHTWIAHMNRRHWPVGPALDVIVENIPCRHVDITRRRRNGYTARLLRLGLELYIALRLHEGSPGGSAEAEELLSAPDSSTTGRRA
ncbi:MAG: hypothetical protein EXQ85_03220 [Alphaproteobacteria bacterium]|nr:hypothetical protein [Alphaproteobacteria bacterium]